MLFFFFNVGQLVPQQEEPTLRAVLAQLAGTIFSMSEGTLEENVEDASGRGRSGRK